MKKFIGILTVICLCTISCFSVFAQSNLSIRIFKSNKLNDLHNVVCEQTGYLVTCVNVPKGEITTDIQDYAWHYFLAKRDLIVKENYTEDQINSYKTSNNLTDDQTYDKLYVEYWKNQRTILEEKLNKKKTVDKKQWTTEKTTKDLTKVSKKLNLDLLSEDSLIRKEYEKNFKN